MDLEQDRRDAHAWAQEWELKQKRKKWLHIALVIIAIAVLSVLVNFVVVSMTRTTFSSADEMREALQGRFETDYAEDIEIVGDEITLTYYEVSHYDIGYAQEYGYSEYDDSVYQDRVAKWDYRNGVIKCEWMSDITVDKDGSLVYNGQHFNPSSDPKPVPFDVSELGETDAYPESELTEDDELYHYYEEWDESRELTEEAEMAASAGE